jgi:hypothetical protein
MDGKDSEKPQQVKTHKRGKTLTLTGIPSKVNDRIKDYQRRISAARGRKINLKTAYVEYLKEKTADPVTQ